MKWSDPAQPPDTDIQTVNQDIGGGRDNFDMVLVTTLDNAIALERYQHHPAHKAASAYVAQARSDRASVDFVFERFRGADLGWKCLQQALHNQIDKTAPA